VRDEYYLSDYEKTVYHSIFKETVLKGKRCAQLSLSQINKMTSLSRSTIEYQLKCLEKKRMIERDKTQKIQTICINVVYREILPI
jgi:predicted transcriptional regulator